MKNFTEQLELIADLIFLKKHKNKIKIKNKIVHENRRYFQKKIDFFLTIKLGTITSVLQPINVLFQVFRVKSQNEFTFASKLNKLKLSVTKPHTKIMC